MNTKELLERYSRSWFDEFVPADRLLPHGKRRLAEAEYERDPAKALMENVEEARDAVQGTMERAKRAQYDGLFEPDAFKAATKKEKERWATCIEIVRGDYQRAKAELAHWREYVQWATEEQAKKVARLEKRLPPEKENESGEEIPF